jgi:hypothetical protein
MGISVLRVEGARQLNEFIRFPYELYRNHACWLPPLLFDEKNFFSKRKNKSMRVCQTVLFLAKDRGKTVGRVMGIINPAYNQLKNEANARFFRFDAVNDPETAYHLLRAVEDWARSQGMTGIIGPFGFSDKDPQGLLISGYEHRAVMVAPYNYPYYVDLIEREGYTPKIDLVEYLIPVPEQIPEFYRKIHERAMRNSRLRIVEFRSKKELKPYIIPVLELMNETFSEIFGYYPLDHEEMEKFAAEYLPILDVDFVKVVCDANKVVSFFIAIPDVGPALQKARGRLFPLGLFHLMREMKRTRYLVLMLGGIKPGYQGVGLDVMMGTKMLETASRRGIRMINSHLELETNTKVRAEMERMGGAVWKRYRIYGKVW